MLADLLHELYTAGIQIELEGESLAVPSGVLTDKLRQRIKEHRDELIQWLSGAADEEKALESESNFGTVRTDWRALSARYYLHHFGCVACIAGGRGAGTRCIEGAALWAAYQNACAA